MQVLPSKELAPYIKHYLFLENTDRAIQKLRLFSDGNTGIVFSFQNRLISGINKETKEYLPSSFLYGQLDGFKDIYSDHEFTLVIVVFQPNGMNQLLQIPAYEFQNSILNLEDIFDQKGLDLQEKLSEGVNYGQKIELLNHFFKTLLDKKTFSNQLIINTSLDFILAHKGYFSLKQLAGYTNYTERHLERKFKECVGLSPKKFGSVVRLHHFLKLLKDKTSDVNLTSIGYDAGFSDQSHLIKEFKKHTGITPREYLYSTKKLTNNLIKTSSSLVF
ncbi:MAG: AraC family transcriptional regulator [Flavobacterium sp.]|uniref:AraC family transcriptional regulator n=1 Tax=Flavobacterium sp. TaxID=239 RepID=UPI001B2C8E29|nr:helix-turn-helix domain-containing protein [Flavobacterium sp.]MBO9583224.1 AraC family transcriptional regulator [Flavobacterium sp.]